MIGMLFEAVVLAFVIGGIIGAATALHLSSPKKIPVRIQSENHRHNGR
ncbi:YtxH domain-containing protein [Kaarinaea lacus]